MRNRTFWGITLSAVLAFVFLAVSAGRISAAETPLPEVGQYVTDSAGILQESERTAISAELEQYAQKTGNQIIVVTIPTLGGEDIEGYSIRLAEKIKAGQKGKDNGAILLIARDEHKLRIEVGYGLEEFLPDGRCGDIIRNDITPAFRNGDFAGGIRSGVLAMIKYVSPEYQMEGAPAPQYETQPAPTPKRDSSFPFAVVIFIIIAVIFNGFGGSRRRRLYRGGYSGGSFWGSGWGSGSGGGFSGGGGDFSGGGGGFGGGGASGGW